MTYFTVKLYCAASTAVVDASKSNFFKYDNFVHFSTTRFKIFRQFRWKYKHDVWKLCSCVVEIKYGLCEPLESSAIVLSCCSIFLKVAQLKLFLFSSKFECFRVYAIKNAFLHTCAMECTRSVFCACILCIWAFYRPLCFIFS